MPRPRQGDGVRLRMRTSGWEAKRQQSDSNQQAAQHLISSFPAPQPPSSPSGPSSPAPTPGPTAGPDTIAVRQSPPLPASLLPRLAEERCSFGAGDAELDSKEQGLALGQDAELSTWPATIALLPDGRISGAVCALRSRIQSLYLKGTVSFHQTYLLMWPQLQRRTSAASRRTHLQERGP